MNPIREAADEAIRYINESAVVNIKAHLWKSAVKLLIERYGVSDENVFIAIEQELLAHKTEIEATPEAPAMVQDAIVEFRTEARSLLKLT